ncbi:hypothetical protein JOM56_013100 [Amanita muscaria]
MCDPSTIPNAQLATVDQRHIIRIFFPGLANDDRTKSTLTAEESATVYNKGILPAIRKAARTIVHNWPPSYRAEDFRSSSKRGGHHSEGTRCLAADDISYFSRCFRENMNDIPWGQHMLFGTEIRGIKDHTEHLPECDPDEYLEAVFNKMYDPWEEVDGHWFVNVGVELLLENKAIVWRAGSASTIMEHLGFSDAEIDSAFSNKRLFEEDVTQHLIEVAGFRSRSGKARGPHQIWYMQAYTTDKSLTYHPEGGKFAKYIEATQAMFCEGGIPSFTQNLLDTYLDARDQIDVAARLEIRVPYQYATQVLLDFPKEVFLETTLVFPRELWW